MWKHVALYNQILIYIFPSYMWEKQLWSFAALLKDSGLRVHPNFYLGKQIREKKMQEKVLKENKSEFQ